MSRAISLLHSSDCLSTLIEIAEDASCQSLRPKFYIVHWQLATLMKSADGVLNIERND